MQIPSTLSNMFLDIELANRALIISDEPFLDAFRMEAMEAKEISFVLTPSNIL
jgi:hypothetical protein